MNSEALIEEILEEAAKIDMVARYREAGLAVYARKCPGCGRYAHVEAGNESGDQRSWLVTACALCGRYECRGGPMEWRQYGERTGRTITIKKLED